MTTSTFEYRGYRIDMDVDEPATESASGIFLTTITVRPLSAAGHAGQPIQVCRRSQGIFLAEASAREAAAERAKAYVDGLSRRGQP